VERFVLAKFKYWYITNTHRYVYVRIYLVCAVRLIQKRPVHVVLQKSNMTAHVQEPEVCTGDHIEVSLPETELSMIPSDS
jgi:hypothetical protein